MERGIVMNEFLSLGGGTGAWDLSQWFIVVGLTMLLVIVALLITLHIRGKSNG